MSVEAEKGQRGASDAPGALERGEPRNEAQSEPEPLDELLLEDDDVLLPPPVPPRREGAGAEPFLAHKRPRPKMTLRIPDDEISRPEPRAAPLVVEFGSQWATSPAEASFPPAPPTPRDESDIPPPPHTTPAPELTLDPDELPSLGELGDPDGEPRFVPLREGIFADEIEEDSWTPWQSAAIEAKESEATDAPSSPIEVEVSPTSEVSFEIPVEEEPEEHDDIPISNPPEIDPDDLVEAIAVPGAPLTPSSPRVSVPIPPQTRAPFIAPRPPGMASTPPGALSVEAASSPPRVPPLAPPSALPGFGSVGGASPIAPPPMSEAAAARKRARPWWEDLFNEDFLRTVGKVTDAEIVTDANFIEDSLGVARGATVLDLACGTGRHAIELSRRGYQVVGFDLSLSMLAHASDEAQERNQKLNFVQGDMREMVFEEAFDGVYCWQTSFGFFEEERNAQVVARVHAALKKGGQFLLDVVNRDYIVRQAPSLAWFEGQGCVCMDEMQMDFITSRIRVKRTMMIDDGRSKEIEYSIRAYSLHELGKLLHDSGFRVAEVTGKIQTPGVFFGCESPRIVILAEKR